MAAVALAVGGVLALVEPGAAQPFGADLLSAPLHAADVAVAEDGSRLYVLVPGEHRLYQVSTTTGRLLTFERLASAVQNPVALEAARGKVYLLGPQGVFVHVPGSSKPPLAMRLYAGLGPNRGEVRRGPGGKLYVVHYNSPALFVIDPVKDRVVAKVAVGAAHTDVALDPAGKLAFLHREKLQAASGVTYVDLAAARVLRTVPYHAPTLIRSATPPQLDAGRRGVYVGYTRIGDTRIRVAHLDHRGNLLRTLESNAFAEKPSGLAVTPDEAFAVAGGHVVFDLRTGRAVHAALTPGGSHRAARAADGRRFYFSDASSRLVTRFTRDPAPLALAGRPAPGQTITILLDQLVAATHAYQLGASFGTSPGIRIDPSRVLPLNLDALLWAALFSGNELIFRDAFSSLDRLGHGAPRVLVPPVPALVGRNVYFAFWTYVDTRRFEVFTLTETALRVRIVVK